MVVFISEEIMIRIMLEGKIRSLNCILLLLNYIIILLIFILVFMIKQSETDFLQDFSEPLKW